LVGNSIKFTQKGQVSVQIIKINKPDITLPNKKITKANLLLFQVQDTGIGIKPE
jgi:signal transduction histidine kinase